MRSFLTIACAAVLLGCGGAASRAWDHVSPNASEAHTGASIQLDARGPSIELHAASRRGRGPSVELDAASRRNVRMQPELGGRATTYEFEADMVTSTGPPAAHRDRALAPPLRRREERRPPRSSERYAQLAPGDATATDATSGPQLIYRAQLRMAVHRVTQNQDAVEALARELGGFLASRSEYSIVVRVPAAQFENAMRRIQELGDVIGREVEVEDVSEEFMDLELRIRTLETMRVRVEQLLAQARDVQAALAVEQNLERITVELERLRGRLRFLANRVSYSTITVYFREHTSSDEPVFWLPFSWLHDLGVDILLRELH